MGKFQKIDDCIDIVSAELDALDRLHGLPEAPHVPGELNTRSAISHLCEAVLHIRNMLAEQESVPCKASPWDDL